VEAAEEAAKHAASISDRRGDSSPI
jgi:hypothetical protein